jgi:hypothetical protein
MLHWCSYTQWDDPESTRQTLQVLPQWSDCELRATILTKNVKKAAFIAFNGDTRHQYCFHQYSYEPLAQDHPPHIGGGLQIGCTGDL